MNKNNQLTNSFQNETQIARTVLLFQKDLDCAQQKLEEIFFDHLVSNLDDDEDNERYDILIAKTPPKDSLTGKTKEGTITGDKEVGVAEIDFENPFVINGVPHEISENDLAEINNRLPKGSKFNRYDEDFKWLVFQISNWKGCFGFLVPKPGYKGPVEENPTENFYKLDNGYSAMKLLTKDQIRTDGRLLSHCVGRSGMGYVERCLKGEIELVSIRKEDKPLFTMEIINNKVTQIKGKRNRTPGFGPGAAKVTKLEEVQACKELLVKMDQVPSSVPDLQRALRELNK